MKKISVYLQAPLSISDSLYYKNLLKFPPKNIDYKTNIKSSGILTNKRKFAAIVFVKNILRKILWKIDYPILNAPLTPENASRIIHGAHCLPKTNTAWVADFEAPWQFWISGRDTKEGKKRFIEFVKKNNCRGLLGWTNTARKELMQKFPEIKEKIGFLPYAMPFISSKKIKKSNITILFSARYFYQKGGEHALQVIDILTKKYSYVDAIIVSPVPKSIKNKYKKNKKIKFYELVPQKELFESIYPSSDIFLYPGYSDTFGFGFVEAMNFGLPIVTVNGYARKEIVVQGKNGFVIENGPISWSGKFPILKNKEETIKELVNKTSLLVENRKLRKKIGDNNKIEVKTGRFSLENRNKILNKIYNLALK